MNTILKFIRRRTCITHTEKEQFGLKLTLKTQNLHRNFRERSSTSEGEHQFRPSHEQSTEVSWTLRKSLRRCSEPKQIRDPRHPQARDLPCYIGILIDALESGKSGIREPEVRSQDPEFRIQDSGFRSPEPGVGSSGVQIDCVGKNPGVKPMMLVRKLQQLPGGSSRGDVTPGS